MYNIDHKGCGQAVQILRNTTLTHKLFLSIMCYSWNSSATVNTPSSLEAAVAAKGVECCKKDDDGFLQCSHKLQPYRDAGGFSCCCRRS